MQRVIEEMSKAKSDVERRLRICIPEIIRECSAFGYLGKNFTFDVSNLSDKVNQRLISLSDEILSDIEGRAKKAIKYAEEEDDEAMILAYINRKIGEEDMVTRLDKHCSTLRYFLEGWIAIGLEKEINEYELTNNIFGYLDNPFASPLWKDTFNAGYLAAAIVTRDYIFGKGNQRNVLKALTEIEQYAINEAFQYASFLKYQKQGAIGYTIHRNSSFDCPYCDSFTGIVHPLTECLLPLHPRCVCYSKPVYEKDMLRVLRTKQYNRLKKSKNYKDVEFDKNTLGLKATHKDHNFDRNKGFYELQVQNAGFKSGHSVIFESEKGRGIGVKSTEGYWDDKLFEIASKESVTENSLLKGLKHCASKPKTKIAILNYPNGGFDIDILNGAIKRYNGLKNQPGHQFRKFDKIICVQDEKIVHEIDL